MNQAEGTEQVTHYMMADPTAPYRGQFVSRLLGTDGTVCYILSVDGERVGGNGTVQYSITLENLTGDKREHTTATKASDGTMHECLSWQCCECECFTLCICGKSEDP